MLLLFQLKHMHTCLSISILTTELIVFDIIVFAGRFFCVYATFRRNGVHNPSTSVI